MQDAGWTIAGSGMKRTRTSRFDGLRTAAMVVVLVGTAVTQVQALTETVVRIYPTAVVTCDQVTLKDIASLSGEEAQMAGGWEITEAPTPGKQVILEQSAIQSALIRRGINASMWVFRGSVKCTISRPMPARRSETLSEADFARSDRAKLKALRTGRRFPTSLPAQDGLHAQSTPDPDTLEGVIYQHVTARLAGMGGRPVIQLGADQKGLLKLSRPTYEFAITDRGQRAVGLVPLEIAIYRQGKLEQMQSVLAEVSIARSVVVANGTINRGQTIGPNDVALCEKAFDKPNEACITDINAVIGQRAVQFVNKGEMLTGKDVEPVPLVVRNDLVTVTVHHGCVSIKAAAKAMASASYGEMVELRNEASKQSFTARVTGPKTAELVFPGAAEPVGMAVASSEKAAGGRN